MESPESEIRAILGVKPPHESVEFINMLIYGEPGAGKTHFLGTCADHPEFFPFLLIDVEGGAMTLRDRQEGVDVIQVRNYQEVVDAINTLYKNQGYYKSVGLDSGTELQKLDMRTVMKERYDANPDRTDIYVPDQRAWGKSNERVRMTIRALKDLPMHSFVTCLQATDIDERSNRKNFFPSLPGKLKAEVAGFFDIVGHLRAKDERGEDGETVIVRTLQVIKTEAVVAKDRTSSLGNSVRDPSVPMLWELITSSDRTNDTLQEQESK